MILLEVAVNLFTRTWFRIRSVTSARQACRKIAVLSLIRSQRQLACEGLYGNIFRVNGPLCGEFTGLSEFPTQRPMTRSFDVFFDLRMNKRLSKQPWGWWFETPSWSLWRQCNDFHVRQSNSLLQWLSVNAYLVCQKLYECIWYISNGDNEVPVYGLTTQSREVAQGIHFTVKAVPVIERYRSEKMAPQ